MLRLALWSSKKTLVKGFSPIDQDESEGDTHIDTTVHKAYSPLPWILSPPQEYIEHFRGIFLALSRKSQDPTIILLHGAFTALFQHSWSSQYRLFLSGLYSISPMDFNWWIKSRRECLLESVYLYHSSNWRTGSNTASINGSWPFTSTETWHFSEERELLVL